MRSILANRLIVARAAGCTRALEDHGRRRGPLTGDGRAASAGTSVDPGGADADQRGGAVGKREQRGDGRSRTR